MLVINSLLKIKWAFGDPNLSKLDRNSAGKAKVRIRADVPG